MANKSDMHGKTSGSNDNHRSGSKAQMKGGLQSTGKGSSSGRPDEVRSQSGRQGSTKQRSSRDDIDTNGGAPSRQTSEAGSKSGQL